MRIVVVSALPAVRAGLRALAGSVTGAEIVGEAASLDGLVLEGAGLLQDAQLVVFDALPDATAADLAPLLTGEHVAPVILGPITGDEGLIGLLRGRAWAYLPRDASAEALVAAVQAVGAGLAVVDPALAPRLQPLDGIEHPPTAVEGAIDALTPRERDVLQLVAAGLPNKQIARRLDISDHTVKFHVAAVLAKLGAGSRTEAVNLGLRRGLVAL